MTCTKYDTCAFSKPLYVGRNNPRFRYALSGYMPGLCPCPDFEPYRELAEDKTVFIENVTDGHFLKLQAEVRNLKENVEKIQSGKKKQYNRYTI